MLPPPPSAATEIEAQRWLPGAHTARKQSSKKQLGFLGPIFWPHLQRQQSQIFFSAQTVSSFHVPSGHCEGFPGAKSEATLTFLSLGLGTTGASVFQHWGACFTGIFSQRAKMMMLLLTFLYYSGNLWIIHHWKEKWLVSSDLKNTTAKNQKQEQVIYSGVCHTLGGPLHSIYTDPWHDWALATVQPQYFVCCFLRKGLCFRS